MADSEERRRKDEWVLMLALETTAENRRELLMALGEFRRRVICEPGCVGCRVLEDTTDINHLVWMESWLDRAHAELATERPRFRALLGAIRLLGAVEILEWLGRRQGPALVTSDARCSDSRDRGEPDKRQTKTEEE